MYSFSKKDLDQLMSHGLDVDEVNKQLIRFRNGFPKLNIQNVASIGQGITVLHSDQVHTLMAHYEANLEKIMVCKFVPASGAASRMFKKLFAFINGEVNDDDDQIKLLEDRIQDLPFFDQELLVRLASRSLKEKVDIMLSREELNLTAKPKALLPFHKFPNQVKTAFEEHLFEGIQYCRGKNNIVRLHFTVSAEHHEKFIQTLNTVVPPLEQKHNCSFTVDFSYQDPATDTIAVDLDLLPFRANGKLLIRPGGHGALLHNLNSINADIVFIKNVDNVVPEWYGEDTYIYKKALAGTLLQLQEKCFGYIHALKSAYNSNLESAVIGFLSEELGFDVPVDFLNWEQDIKNHYLLMKLNRPIRVCGLIRSIGNTGGGPFYIEENDGARSLQLVETAQIDLDDPEVKTIVEKGTHANITDLVCGLKNYEGKRFDLSKFSDPETGFIAEKSLNGKNLKALEHPGLWNGAMADWNTKFIEVPDSVFNPVKTIFDLLKKEHQPKSDGKN